MKILILGHGKSGTTVFLFKVAGGLPNCQAFSGGDPRQHQGGYENAVYKYTYSERKGRTFDLFTDHDTEMSYDRKIWMARDPRDIAVSEMLYRWHKGHRGSKKQYQAHLDLVQKKEQDPGSIPLHVLCRYIGHEHWPMSTEEVAEQARFRYERMHDFVKSLGRKWFLFKYEDMIEKNLDRLHDYLGFEIKDDAEIPVTTKKSKVARKKAHGEWRYWFTEEDVELYKPIYLPYMEMIGYDCEDWSLSPEPAIESEFSSLYIKRLVRQSRPNTIHRLKEAALSRFFSRRERNKASL
jgi:hypothetical protein